MKRKELKLPYAPLMYGDRSMQVLYLQECLDHVLKRKGKKKLESIEPNYYGHETSEAVAAFQLSQKDIRISGTYDKVTRARLREAIK